MLDLYGDYLESISDLLATDIRFPPKISLILDSRLELLFLLVIRLVCCEDLVLGAIRLVLSARLVARRSILFSFSCFKGLQLWANLPLSSFL
jgi:hypothetical protein